MTVIMVIVTQHMNTVCQAVYEASYIISQSFKVCVSINPIFQISKVWEKLSDSSGSFGGVSMW